MSDGFTIRTAGPADLAAVDALLARSYPRLLAPDYPPSALVLALPLLARAQPALLASGRYYLAEAPDGQVIGAGGWSRAAPGSGETGPGLGHVRHLVTDHRHLRRGIARAILERVFAEARAGGVRELDCLSTRTAVPFYAAVGFERLEEVTVALRPGIDFPAVRMRAQI
ncbi:GNAT family N-acetyltransferase [Defluviimonas sp. WL0024]|uniref:GNAT family N-acetyltransferase n=1 Tax=Albidovulum salinarum TaxID=2984153 RepID=A0ABT2X4B7_9RHOB|nr:GNAT family N-acetyltransferase [Defluviimonas sp. WL0024]MCU9848783.1 GNAT family N-acetyltransferase [Defluviimonas sp. WL0024]